MSTRDRESVLVINAGSSSIKFSVFHRAADNALTLAVSGQIAGIGTAPRFAAKDAQGHGIGERAWTPPDNPEREHLLRFLLDWLDQAVPGLRLAAAGHRVVHGGQSFSAPVLLTPEVLAELERLIPLAPLHQPHNILAIDALARAHPSLPQVACFDTAFHSTQPWRSRTYGLPRRMAEDGIRRYGFHGLSYEYIARRLRDVAPDIAQGRVVVAHLGNGASLCALHRGHSVDTTMGFTALDGVPMGTRSGSVDPGVLLYLMREKGMDADGLERLLYRESGLLGLSGLSNDMRILLESGETRALEAVDLFCHRVAKEIVGLATSMGGLDALVFTAGIGEHSAPVRAAVCANLAWIGLDLDDQANAAERPVISSPSSTVPVLIVPTDEEVMIAGHTLAVLQAA